MHEPEDNFSPELLEQQIEQPDTRSPHGEARLIHDLQTMYDQEKSDAIERVWARVALHRHTASQQLASPSLSKRQREPIIRSFPMKQAAIASRPQKRFTRTLSLIAAILVCAILVGSMALVLRLAQRPATSTGGQRGISTTARPSDTHSPSGNEEGKVVASWSQPQIRGGTVDLRSFAWSPNSQHIVADSQDIVQIRDAATGKSQLTITPGGLSAAWSPDGHYLAVDSTIINATTGTVVRRLLNVTASSSSASNALFSPMLPRSGGDVVDTVAWSPNSKMLAGALSGPAYGNKVIIWNVNTGQIMYTFLGQSADTVASLAWSHDGKYIASASFDGVVKVWNARTGQVIFHHNSNARVAGLALAPTGLTLAFLTNENTIEVWNITTHKKITSYHAPDIMGSLVWSPDGTKIASASDNKVLIWSATTGDTLYTFTRHPHYVSALAWSPNGKYLVSASYIDPVPRGSPTPVIRPGPYALVWIA
ncbi:MAG: WD40 repeat domain-containing protein [Chloroflexota bacterium]|nr:WD40 repeat domain-containing protein [Chloroflexota bacterium]